MENYWKEDKPKFKHDCETCKFLGSYMPIPGIVNDLYICIYENHGTIIKRFGNDGPDYWAMELEACIKIANDGKHDFIGIAIRRAIREGYVTPDMALSILESI